jgi:glycine/serine hydroxymethyltransferase
LRFGATALASRGFSREQFAEVGGILSEALANGGEDPDGSLAGRVAELASAMPLYRYLV